MSISYNLSICTDAMAEQPNAEHTKYAEPQPENTMETDEPEPITTPLPQPSMTPNVPVSEQTAIRVVGLCLFCARCTRGRCTSMFIQDAATSSHLETPPQADGKSAKKEAVWQKPPSNAPC